MKRIMLVDDNEDFLMNMKSALKKQGYDVRVTTSCQKALTIVKEFNPHLILMDVNVGDEDGRQTCLDIKMQAAYDNIPIILLSANHDYEANFQHYKANAFWGKPFTFSFLSDSIRKYL